MKTFSIVAAAALFLSSSAAFADPYVSVFGGPSFDPHLSAGGRGYGTDTGFNVGARVGTYLDTWFPLSGFSVEADGMYTNTHYNAVNPRRLESASFMGNLIYHVPTDLIFGLGLYGGAGLGVVDDMLTGTLHGNSTVMAWQAIGGVEYPVAPATSLFAEYRYQNAHDANIGGLQGVGNTSNNLSVGLKLNL